MVSTRFWALWCVFNTFFLSWLFDWTKLANEWTIVQKIELEKKKKVEIIRIAMAPPKVKRNVTLPKEGPFGPFWTMDRLRHGGSVRIVAP